MSWRKVRVFKCSICHAEKPESTYGYLPFGWRGSDKRFSECVCDDCYWKMRALRKYKEEQ